MAVTKAKKTEMFSRLADIAKAPGTRVFVNFHGLSVTDAMSVRRALRASDVKYVVAKKTLAKKAWNEAGLGGSIPELPGELAIAYSEDDIAPAREVFKFQKTLKDKITIVGGVFEQRFVGPDEMKDIALIPSRETLYAQVLNIINSPIQGLVLALNAIAEKKEA